MPQFTEQESFEDDLEDDDFAVIGHCKALYSFDGKICMFFYLDFFQNSQFFHIFLKVLSIVYFLDFWETVYTFMILVTLEHLIMPVVSFLLNLSM